MGKGDHTPVNDIFFRLEKESKSIHSSLKKSWQKNDQNKKRAAETAAPSRCLMLPLLVGARAKRCANSALPKSYDCAEFINEPLERSPHSNRSCSCVGQIGLIGLWASPRCCWIAAPWYKARKLPIGWQAGPIRPNASGSSRYRKPERVNEVPLIVISSPLRCKWMMH